MRSLNVVLGVGLLITACAEPPPPPEHHFVIRALSDGVPVPGATVITNGQRSGETDEDGEVRVGLTGPNGALVSLDVECPDGFRSPTDVRPLRLQTFEGLSPEHEQQVIRRTVTCLPTERGAAFVVRTVGFTDLPILIRGREVARTDASGAAHFSLRLRPNRSVRVRIDTSARPELRPQNPESTVQMPDRDELFILDQPFELQDAPRRPRRRRAPSGPNLPVRI